MHTIHNPPARPLRRGVALLLATIAVVISSVIAYTYLSAQQTSIGIARNIKNHASARFVAETGLDLAFAYINSDSSWRTNRAVGVWASNVSFGLGVYTIRCDDGIDANDDGVISVPSEGDGNLTDDASEAFTLTVTGTVGACSHKATAVIRPTYQGPIVVYVVGNPNSLAAKEADRKALMESYNWQVNLLDDGASQSSFDNAIADASVVLVSPLATATGTKLKTEVIGIVSEYAGLSSNLGLSSASNTYTASNSNQIDITNNSNYISQPYSIATLTFATVGSVAIDYPSGTMTSDLAVLGQKPATTTRTLVTMEAADNLYGGGTAADRRVLLPTGNYSINQLNSDGTNLFKRAMEWASGAAGISAFGYQTIFSSSQKSVQGKQIATQATLNEAGTLTSITAYVKVKKNTKVCYALYRDLLGQPSTLVVQSATYAPISTGLKWLKLSVAPTYLTAGTYWLSLSFENKASIYRYLNNTGQTRYSNNDATSGGFTSSWGSSSSTLTRQFDIYGTYTSASGNPGTLNTGTGGYSYEDIDLR